MKFVYLGAEGAPDVTRMYGHVFPLGRAVEVTDEHAIRKLSGHKFFAPADDERASVATAAAAHRAPGAEELANTIDALQADVARLRQEVADKDAEIVKLRARIDQLSVYSQDFEPETEQDVEFEEEAETPPPSAPEMDPDAMGKDGMLAYAKSKGWTLDKRKNEDNLRDDLKALIQAEAEDGDAD